MLKVALFLMIVGRSLYAVSGCNNLTLATGWTCIDSNAISGSGSNPTSLTLVHSSAVNKGDILVTWANLVTTSWTTQTIAVIDNAGNTFTQWTPGLHSYSTPANRWVAAVYYTIASANKSSGYQMTCTASANGGASARCDDVSITVIRPPKPATSLTEDGNNWIHTTSAAGGCPCLTVAGGQSLTTTHADLVLGGGNSAAAPDQVDSPFVGIDGDGSFTGPMYYLMASVQSTAGAITAKWYIDAATSDVGSALLALTVGQPSGCTLTLMGVGPC